jgi:hypothetical protein
MWPPIGGQTRVECSALQFITRSPQSPVATILISLRSTIRKFSHAALFGFLALAEAGLPDEECRYNGQRSTALRSRA